MTNHSSLGGSASNIVAIPDLPRLLDPVFLDAHRLVDQVHRAGLIGLIPQLRHAVRGDPARAAVAKPVGQKNLSSAAWMEPPMPGPVAASGSGCGMQTS